MAVALDRIDTLAHEILDCVCQALDDAAATVEGAAGCPCRTCVVAGRPAWDNCCSDCDSDGTIGGQLHVWVPRIYAYDKFPDEVSEVQGFSGCKPPNGLAADFIIETVRCSPTIDDQGIAPECEDLERTARIVNIDLFATYQAVMCCIPGTAPRGRKFVIRESLVTEPEGGCVASQLRVTVDLGRCVTCPKASP